MEKNKHKHGIAWKILAGSLAGLLVVGGVLAYRWWPAGGDADSGQAGVSLTVDPNAENRMGDLPEADEDETDPEEGPMVDIPGYGGIELVAGTKEQTVSFVNPESNPCYFTISLSVGGSAVYTSGLIPPGMGLYTIELEKELAAGVYEDAVLQYRCFSLEDGKTEYNGANVALEVRVV